LKGKKGGKVKIVKESKKGKMDESGEEVKKQ
jgi:hypothetical protein